MVIQHHNLFFPVVSLPLEEHVMGTLLSTLTTPRQVQTNVLLLPEVLYQVFRLLNPRDLKAAVLVCRLWREVGEAPRFWSWVVLRVTTKNQSTMLEALQSRRMKTVRKLMIEEVSEEVVQAVDRHQGLKVIEVEDKALSTVGSLTRAVIRLEKLDIGPTKLTVQQGEAILTSISAGDSQLKKLNLTGNNMFEVDPDLMARAVNKLKKFTVISIRLDMRQFEANPKEELQSYSSVKYVSIPQRVQTHLRNT